MSAMNEPVFPIQVANPYGDGWMSVCPTTMRAYAAIHMRVPDSGIPELDDMIRQARRQEMVGRALQGLLATGIWTVNECAANAEAAADAAMMEDKP